MNSKKSDSGDQAKLTIEEIGSRIYFIRGHRVMLDSDLAQLYGVETRVLNQAVRRNIQRFPGDFMFELTLDEFRSISQIVTSKAAGRGGRQKRPLAFTEQGVAMLSSVLSSPRAVEVNIAIVRAFVKLRELVSNNQELVQKLNQLEQKYTQHDAKFEAVFEAIRQLMKVGSPLAQRKIKGIHRD